MRRRKLLRPVNLALLAIALNPIACDCEDPQITDIDCDFAIRTPDGERRIEFRETEVETQRSRTFQIENTGNQTLENFNLVFSEVNEIHYRVPGIEDVRVDPNGTVTLNVIFEPLAESPNLSTTFTLSHNDVSGDVCPSFIVNVEGSSFERIELEDGGVPDDAGPGDGGQPDDDGGPIDPLDDAGVVFPPDAGLVLPPGARFSARGALQEARSEFALVPLADGTLLAIGGFGENGQAVDSIERFDPTVGRSRIVGRTQVPRGAPGAAFDEGTGKVWIVGGRTEAVGGLLNTTVESYDPDTHAVDCPGAQGQCDLDDINQGRGLLDGAGRLDPLVTAPSATGANDLVVMFGVDLVDNAGELVEVPKADGVVLDLNALTVTALNGADAITARRDEVRVAGPDGAVLVVGGETAAGVVLGDVVRLVFDPDPRLATQTPTAGTLEPRARGAGALLSDNDVYLMGGTNLDGDALGVVERLTDAFDQDGATDFAVEVLDEVIEARIGPSLVALPGDLLLLAGGVDQAVHELETAESIVPRRDAELFVPFLGGQLLRVSPDDDLAQGRFQHEAALVTIVNDDQDPDDDEDVVVFLGGTSVAPRRAPHPQAERFRITRNTFEVWGLMGPGAAFERNAPAILMSLGGIDPHTGALSGRVRAFDTQSDLFDDRPRLAEPRRDHSATLLDDNNTMLIAGGRDAAGQVLSSASLYNPFIPFDIPLGVSLARARANHTTTLLGDGRVLLCGGQGSGGEAIDTCEIFTAPSDLLDPETYDEATFDLALGRMSTGRVGHSATLIEDTGEVLLAGGGDVETDLVNADLFDPVDDRVTSTGLPTLARRGHAAVYLGSGRVLLAGGEIFLGGLGPTPTAEVYVRTTSSFIAVDDEMLRARVGVAGISVVGGDVLIVGGSRLDQGETPTRSISLTELYSPGPTGIGEFTNNLDIPLSYGRSDVVGADVFGRGVAAGGTHRDGSLFNGDERRTPLFFVDKLVNPGEDDPVDAGP
jgi:hypothetical protein